MVGGVGESLTPKCVTANDMQCGLVIHTSEWREALQTMIRRQTKLADIEMPTRIIYKRRNEKEKRLAKLLLIATVVLAIGGAGIAACHRAR